MTGYQKLKDQNDKYKDFVKKVTALSMGSYKDSELRDYLKKYLFDLYYGLTETDA